MRHDLRWHIATPLWDLSLQDSDAQRQRFRRPVVLRFASDQFMDEFQQTLERDASRLHESVARNETWQEEQAGWQTNFPANNSPVLKLFQPVHGRFYLVSASLVCRTEGLPDRFVDRSNEERVSFVVRRLKPRAAAKAFDPTDETTYDELGWFGDRQQGTWVRLPNRNDVAENEERLPLFTTTFPLEARTRRIHSGLIPVASRELYERGVGNGANRPDASDFSADQQQGDTPPADARLAEFEVRVLGSLQRLVEFPDPTSERAASAERKPGASETFDAQAREVLTLTLLDLVEFLRTHLAPVMEALHAGSDSGLSRPQRELFRFLDDARYEFKNRTWRRYLADIDDHRKEIERGTFHPSLMILRQAATRSDVRRASGLLAAFRNASDRRGRLTTLVARALREEAVAALQDLVDRWRQEIEGWNSRGGDAAARRQLLELLLELSAWLQSEVPEVLPSVGKLAANKPTPNQQPLIEHLTRLTVAGMPWRDLLVRAEKQRVGILANDLNAEIEVLRVALSPSEIHAALGELLNDKLVHAAATARQRTPTPPADTAAAAGEAYYQVRCVYERPRCKHHVAAVVSAPSQPFQLAAFFDPDAPARPVAIRLPTDTSIAGLRKFPKNASVMLSSKLRQQMARVSDASLNDLDEGNLGGEPSFNLGMVCTLSIPIITICALILLMIIVQLLNIVFWWLPYFKICLPVRRG
jgi:hypothetical protein